MTAVPKRFPVSVFVSVALTVAVYLSIADVGEIDWEVWSVAFGLAWLASVVFALLGEALEWSRSTQLGVVIVASVAVAAVTVGYQADHSGVVFIGVALFVGLIVARFPRPSGDVWESNFRMWTGATFSGFVVTVVNIGVVLFLVALDEFFDVSSLLNSDFEEWFGYAAATLYLFVFPWLTLSRVPSSGHDMTWQLRPWVRYLTLILVVVAVTYLALIYTIAVDVLIAGDLPEGQIGWLVGGFSGFGVAVWMIAHPLAGEHRLVGWYHRRLFHMLVVPIVLLAAALYRRVSDYGITESRYVLGVALVWLTVVTLTGLVGRADLRTAPIVLVAVLIGLSFGPQSVDPVSVRSQVSQLSTLLAERGALVGGTIVESSLNDEDSRRVRSILRYLRDEDALDQWLISAGLSSADELETLVLADAPGDIDVNRLILGVPKERVHAVVGPGAVAHIDLRVGSSDAFAVADERYVVSLTFDELTLQSPSAVAVFPLAALTDLQEPWLAFSAQERRDLLTFSSADQTMTLYVHELELIGGRAESLEGTAVVLLEPAP